MHVVACSFCSVVQNPHRSPQVLKECHLNFCWEFINPDPSTLAVRSDIDLLEPCSWVRSLSRHRASALGARCQATTHVDRVSPDGISICNRWEPLWPSLRPRYC